VTRGFIRLSDIVKSNFMFSEKHPGRCVARAATTCMWADRKDWARETVRAMLIHSADSVSLAFAAASKISNFSFTFKRETYTNSMSLLQLIVAVFISPAEPPPSTETGRAQYSSSSTVVSKPTT